MNEDYHFEFRAIPFRDPPSRGGPEGDLSDWLRNMVPYRNGSKLAVRDLRIYEQKVLPAHINSRFQRRNAYYLHSIWLNYAVLLSLWIWKVRSRNYARPFAILQIFST